jgi:hypothetical protein
MLNREVTLGIESDILDTIINIDLETLVKRSGRCSVDQLTPQYRKLLGKIKSVTQTRTTAQISTK